MTMQIPIRELTKKFWNTFLASEAAQRVMMTERITRRFPGGTTRMVYFSQWSSLERDVLNGWLLEQNAYLVRENKKYYVQFLEPEYATLFVLRYL